ncbi:MAG: hypothetical protein LBG06_07575 [Deltaproteobacteria bacterium]|nr:hypothetical protein [Deltaproteobacteria bacterium]
MESTHYIAGRLEDVRRGGRGAAPLEIVLSGPGGAPWVHRVLIYSDARAEEFLLRDAGAAGAVLAEVKDLRFLRGGPGGPREGHFLSCCRLGSLLQRAGGRPLGSLHLLRCRFLGTAAAPGGGLAVLFREARGMPGGDLVFQVRGRAARELEGARPERGSEFLLRTADLRPVDPGRSGWEEFTGTGFSFFHIGLDRPWRPAGEGEGTLLSGDGGASLSCRESPALSSRESPALSSRESPLGPAEASPARSAESCVAVAAVAGPAGSGEAGEAVAAEAGHAGSGEAVPVGSAEAGSSGFGKAGVACSVKAGPARPRKGSPRVRPGAAAQAAPALPRRGRSSGQAGRPSPRFRQ